MFQTYFISTWVFVYNYTSDRKSAPSVQIDKLSLWLKTVVLTLDALEKNKCFFVEKLGFFRYMSVFLNWASGLNLNSHELVTILVLVLKGCVWFSFLFISLNWGLSRGQVLVSENVFLLESKIMSLNFERRDTKSL